MTKKRDYKELSKTAKEISESPLPRRKLNRDEARAVAFVVKKLRIDPDEAKRLLFKNEKRSTYLIYHRMMIDIRMMELIEDIQKAIGKATKDGELSSVRDGSFAIKALTDKLFESKKETPTVNQGISIKVNFPFKPQKEVKEGKSKEIGTNEDVIEEGEIEE